MSNLDRIEWAVDCLKSRMDAAERSRRADAEEQRADAPGDYETAYEIAIIKGGSVVKRLGFSEKKTRSVLLDYVNKNRDAIVQACDKSDLEKDTKYDGNALVFGKVKVGFTGETKKGARA